MKILIISAVFPPEPVVSAKLSFDLANFISNNHKTVVLTPIPSRPLGFIFDSNMPTYRFKHVLLNSFTSPKSKFLSRLIESISFGLKCSKYIIDNQGEIDKIYSNSWPLFAQYFVIRTAKKYSIPIIFHVQDIYPESLSNKIKYVGPIFSFFLKPIDSYNLKNSDSVIAISEGMKNYLVSTRNIISNKVHIVSNWQDENDFINFQNNIQNVIPEKELFTFMYLGNIGPVAGVDLLVKSFIQADLKNARLVIAGAGSKLEEIKNLVGNNLKSSIEFWSVPNGKVPEIQNKADVMLLPMVKGGSFSSIPSKLPAYMFSKKPIVACVESNSDTAKAILESDSGWICDPENIDSLSSLMKTIFFSDHFMLSEKGSSGFDYAIKHFSKSTNLPKLTSIILE